MTGGNDMKKILLLSTGGTIASRIGGHGFEPQIQGGTLLEQLGEISSRFCFEYEDLFRLDSSNIQPEHWQIIARSVYHNIDKYDGIIITHGTDTMAYTASALSFMLQNLNKSVIMTGSQLPIENPLTDAKTNLYTALAAVENGITGVTLAFNRKIICGTRAVKISTMGFNAFDSINAAYMARVFADGMRVYSHSTHPTDPSKGVSLADKISPDVFLLKLLPGTKPEIFDMLPALGYRGIVIEAFGAGGLHYIQRDILNKLKKLYEMGISVVVCSQCLYEYSDLSIYEVGQRILECGVISAKDMTTEAASVKLMWALGQTDNDEEIRKIFATNYAGEITSRE